MFYLTEALPLVYRHLSDLKQRLSFLGDEDTEVQDSLPFQRENDRVMKEVEIF